MWRIRKSLMLLIMVMAAACNNGGTDFQDQEILGVEEKNESYPNQGGESGAALDELAVNEVVGLYLKLKDALVASDASEARQAAKNLADQLEKSRRELSDMLLEDTRALVNTDDLKAQREHFRAISQNLYQMLKVNDTEQDLYRQYCPMAFDGEGAYWISSSEEIRNPYFGDKMLKCGRVEEEL